VHVPFLSVQVVEPFCDVSHYEFGVSALILMVFRKEFVLKLFV